MQFECPEENNSFHGEYLDRCIHSEGEVREREIDGSSHLRFDLEYAKARE